MKIYITRRPIGDSLSLESDTGNKAEQGILNAVVKALGREYTYGSVTVEDSTIAVHLPIERKEST